MNDSTAEGMLNRAAKYCDDGQLEEAHALASMVVDERPEEPRAAFILGNCHMKAKRPQTAYYLYRYIQKFPAYRDSPQLFDQIGMALAEMGSIKEAEGWYLKSDAKGGTTCTYASLASLYTKMGDPQKAVESAEKALKLSPDNQEAKWNGSLALLKLKQWRKGWEWYDTTLGTPIRPKPPSLNGIELPTWEGEGGNVLIYGEQGLGDEIMFASILPDAIKKANRVVCAVDPKLIGLFSRSFPEAVFVSTAGQGHRSPRADRPHARLCPGVSRKAVPQ
jgi:tetratricopeptide (TPR) repeat protein